MPVGGKKNIMIHPRALLHPVSPAWVLEAMRALLLGQSVLPAVSVLSHSSYAVTHKL